MNAEPYIMTPSFVLFDTTARLLTSFPQLKKYMMDQLLLNGCTMIFTYAEVNYEHELQKKINQLKTNLLSSPVDFLIGVKIPPRLVTPSFIRKCKKEKVPGIIVEIEDIPSIEAIPWGWVRQALFPLNCPLIPAVSEISRVHSKVLLAAWKNIMEKEKIPALQEEINEDIPLSEAILNKIGLFPEKSCLLHGSEISYNLYCKSREIKNLDAKELFLYYKDILVVTVHKGEVIRAGKEVYFKPGNGEFVKINTPSFFSIK